MLAFICFMCPGLFSYYVSTTNKWNMAGLYNALNGLGGTGQFDTKTSANANTAVYATFTMAAFFAGYDYCSRLSNDYTYLQINQ